MTENPNHKNTLSQKPLAASFRVYAKNPQDFSSIQGVPPHIAFRLPGFVDFGMNGDELVEAIRKAGPEKGPATPGWSDVFMEYGNQAMKLGDIAEQNLNIAQAERTFLDASFWYFFARFPHIFNEKGQKAYECYQEAYLRAAKHFNYPLEIVDINIDGKTGKAYLRYPNTLETKTPVVIISGGIDTWKSELEIHSLSESFLKQGIATLVIDLPGTGECPIPASPSAHLWFLSTLDVLQTHPRIDGSRIGYYGLSFGGYWSTKMAFIAPWLSGVINTGGPIHHTFQPEWIKLLPPGLTTALGRMLDLQASGDKNRDEAELLTRMEELSLDKQIAFPIQKYAPILCINGEEDEVVPIAEIDFLKDKGIKQDTLIFVNDRHVASRNWNLHEEFSVRWMIKKLGV